MAVPTTTSRPSAASADRARLAAGTRLGPVHLTVTDLGRSVPFYESVVGLRGRTVADGVVELGAGGEAVLVLHEDRAARPAGRHAGLYHVALRYPSRLELARAGVRIAAAGVAIDGASDHGTHEAIYLPDPDGIGLELAVDRPKAAWPDLSGPNAFAAAGPRPLDQRGLFALVSEEPGVPSAAPGLDVGHLHLTVSDIEVGLDFYRDALGFDVVMGMPTAMFVSAGGYHHHVAFNTWKGEGIPPQPEGVVGLREWTLLVDGAAELDAVRGRLAGAGVAEAEVSGGSGGSGGSGVDGGLRAVDPFGMAVVVRVA